MSSIRAVNITDFGNLYDSAPAISITLPPFTATHAVASPVMTGDGSIDSIHVSVKGSGYLVTPNVLVSGITDSSGKQATASLLYDSINDRVSSISLVDSGKFYNLVPAVIFSAPDSGIISASATATIESGQVTSLTLTNQGAGYYSSPTITLSAPTDDPNNYRAFAEAIMDSDDDNNSVSHIRMLTNGKFYTGQATATVDSSTGTAAHFSASLTAILNFETKKILRIDIDSAGKYYDSATPPVITLAPPPSRRFDVGEKVTQVVGNTTMHGEVSHYNPDTRIISVIHAGAADGTFKQFTPDADSSKFLVGSTHGNKFEILSVSETNKISEIEQNEDFSATTTNVLLDFLDFSETNPFGDPGD